MNRQILRKIIFTSLFAIPFVPFLVSSSFFFPFITTKAFAFRLIVEAVFAAWAMLALAYPEYRPKRSLLLYALGFFLLVIGLADLFGLEPWKSFWSNYERMEGFISLLHLGAYFLVISSVFNEQDWRRFWQTNLLASFLMVLYCSFQLAGILHINQGGARVDGTLGNASYLAVYMLVNIFIALFLWWRARAGSRWVYLTLIALQAWILYYTATRGAILGLLGGLLLMALLNLRSRERLMKRASVMLLAGLVFVVGGFWLIKGTPFVKSSPILARFASISTEELKTGGRSFVWPMAWQGIKERPILGWGQDNFNYVFNEYYDPKMYLLEPWFDRAHNIFLDWGIAGGVLGLLSYLLLYAILLWLIARSTLVYEEKTILIALLAAYFFHNFFVFDQLISYIFFFSFLAYIHHHTVSSENALTQSQGHPTWSLSLEKSFVPILIVFLVLVYFANVKPIRANLDLITALQNIGGDNAAKLKTVQNLEQAYKLSRLGRPETVEQIAANSPPILTSGLSNDEKKAYYDFAKAAVVNQAAEFKGDARYEIIAATFLAQTNQLEEATAHFQEALKLIPGKQLVYFEYGNVLLNRGDKAGALAAFKQAYDLSPEYLEAKLIYLIGAIYTGNLPLERRLIAEAGWPTVAFDDRVASAYYVNGRRDEVRNLLDQRIKLDPANKATYENYLKQL